MAQLSQEAPIELKRFLDEADTIDVRPDYLAGLNLKWDQPDGSPVNLGTIGKDGQIRTDGSDDDVAEHFGAYIDNLAAALGGRVDRGNLKKDGARYLLVVRSDGTKFRVEHILDRLPDWIVAIKTFQDAVRKRGQREER